MVLVLTFPEEWLALVSLPVRSKITLYVFAVKRAASASTVAYHGADTEPRYAS